MRLRFVLDLLLIVFDVFLYYSFCNLIVLASSKKGDRSMSLPIGITTAGETAGPSSNDNAFPSGARNDNFATRPCITIESWPVMSLRNVPLLGNLLRPSGVA